MALETPMNREPSCILREGRCSVHGITSPAALEASVAEVRALRKRVLELETALAEAQNRAEPARETDGPPADQVVDPSDDARRSDDPSQAWADPEATFEERLAARAFFHHGDVDQPARRWFLGRS